MAVFYPINGKDIRVIFVDHLGATVNFGPTVPEDIYPKVSMVEFGPSYFDATWSESPVPRSVRDELLEMRKEVDKGYLRPSYEDRPPPNNRKEKRRKAAIARKGRNNG